MFRHVRSQPNWREVMSTRRVISLVAVTALGIAYVSADAFAAHVTARGGYGYNPSHSYASATGYGGGCATDGGLIMCDGRCWLNDYGTNYHWDDCQAVRVRPH